MGITRFKYGSRKIIRHKTFTKSDAKTKNFIKNTKHSITLSDISISKAAESVRPALLPTSKLNEGSQGREPTTIREENHNDY